MSRFVYLVIFDGDDVPDYEVYGRKASAEKAAREYNERGAREGRPDDFAIVYTMWVRPRFDPEAA